NPSASTVFYTLSLHDALPICLVVNPKIVHLHPEIHLLIALEDYWLAIRGRHSRSYFHRSNDKVSSAHILRCNRLHLIRNYQGRRDRKSTRLNSSHVSISYAVF